MRRTACVRRDVAALRNEMGRKEANSQLEAGRLPREEKP